jgi:adenine-specific DNA-methyltransferase
MGEDGKLKHAINFDLLRQMLSGDVVEGDEAYEFTWVGKKAAIVEANKPIRKTLRPCVEESRDWDNTENLYIEGDNLEVLKLLQESYLGKVKMIYIDPPYNTGNDFIYRDAFAQSSDEYQGQLGMFDEETGYHLFKNTDSNGRFHSDWCSMIYSRLMLARNLLTDDGAIFISIDDNEVDNLRKICDDVFGAANYISTLIWDLGTGTTAGHFTRGHEYIVCYAKNKFTLPNFRNFNENERISHGALKKISHKNPAVEITFPVGFEFEGDNAVFKGEIGNSEKEYILSDEMRFENGKLAKEVTIKAGFAMRNQVEDFINGKEVYDTKGQRVIRFYFNSNGILFYEKEKTVINPRSVLSDIANTKNGTSELNNLFGAKYFDFPKPSSLIKFLIQLVTDRDSIVLDFFSGSATTAHAVMQLNAEDGGHRKFIMVQLPEQCDEKSEAYKAGYKNICEIGKERIRRAGDKIKEESSLTTQGLDTGFRVFKLDDTNMTDVYYSADEYNQGMLSMFESNVKADRTDLDLLFGCLLEWGLPLSLPYTSEQIEGCTVHTYNDGDLIACFAENISDSVIKEIARRQPLRAVFRDSSFANSSSKINVGEIFKMLAPDTGVKVI